MVVNLKRFFALYLLVPVLAILAVWASGFWEYGGDGTLEYGVPFPWKTSQIVPTCASCPLPVSYNWVFFLLDVIFYGAIGYAIVFVYSRLIRKPAQSVHGPKQDSPALVTIPPTPFLKPTANESTKTESRNF